MVMIGNERDVSDDTGAMIGGTGSDHGLARRLATEAGRVLMGLRSASGFSDPAILRRAGDRTSHALLMRRLRALRRSDIVLSEEGADDRRRLFADRVWIVDPLDGTREFAERDRSDWAVHVALWERGDLRAGAVALPALGVTLATDVPPTLPAATDGPMRIAVSRTRPPAFVEVLAARIGAELVPMGSAGAKVAAVMRGEVDAYLHSGGQYEWDSAAPVAVAAAMGLHTSRLGGVDLAYNQPNPYLPDLLICRPELASELVQRTTNVMPVRRTG